MKTLLFIISITVSISCKYNRKTPDHLASDNTSLHSTQDADSFLSIFPKDTLLNLYSASITFPKGWRCANDDILVKMGDATVRYRFHNKNGKLFYLSYGLSTIGNPAEPNVISARSRKGYIRNNVDTSDIIFSDNPRLIKIRKDSDYNFFFQKVSAFEATLFKPKRIGNGYTGVFIDSIGEIASNIADLSFYAKDLDDLENIEFEKVIRTLALKHFQ